MKYKYDPGGDPTEQGNLPTPPPPAPTGTNPFSSAPATSTIATSSPAGPAPPVDPGTPDPAFVRAVNVALQGRLGVTKFGLIPAADKTELINKIWQDPSIQSYFTSNFSILSTDVNAAGQFGNLISQVMQGQGNDPSVAVDYTNMLQAAGVPLTTSEQAGLAGATAAVNAPVPRPFGTNTVSGYDYGTPMPAGGWTGTGQSYGWQTHMGVDYGTRSGDRIEAPFAGTVHVAQGVEGYGNIVYVTLDDGRTMGFGHVAQGEVTSGQRVNPGDLIAIAGQNIGSAQGSVTIVTWQGPDAKFDKNGVLQGGYMNPHDVLDPIFQGATFSSLGFANAAGTGMPTVNKVLDTEYPTIKSDFQTYFGRPPSPEDVYDILNHGSSPAQWSDYIRAMPSHIDGLTQGQYYDMRQMADSVSTSVLGHPSTDNIVQELHGAGLTSKQAVTNWYNEHGVTGIDDATYNQIYKASSAVTAAVHGQGAGADPRDIKNIHDFHTGHPGPQQA